MEAYKQLLNAALPLLGDAFCYGVGVGRSDDQMVEHIPVGDVFKPEEPFTEWHKWNYLDEDIKWELEELKDDVEEIFNRAKHSIRSAYYAPQQHVRGYFYHKKKWELDRVQSAIMNWLVMPNKEWAAVLDKIFNTIREGATEGFGDDLREEKDMSQRMAQAAQQMVNEEWTFAKLLSCLDDQLCELYR